MIMSGKGQSQKIFGNGLLGRDGPALVGGCLELDELLPQLFVEHQDGGDVVAAVAVVGGRPHRHQLLVEHLLVPLHYQLVGTHDLGYVVGVVEGLHHVPSEQVPRSPRRKHPPRDVYIGRGLPSGSDHIRSHIEPS